LFGFGSGGAFFGFEGDEDGGLVLEIGDMGRHFEDWLGDVWIIHFLASLIDVVVLVFFIARVVGYQTLCRAVFRRWKGTGCCIHAWNLAGGAGVD
jgi:hypothetical protein